MAYLLRSLGKSFLPIKTAEQEALFLRDIRRTCPPFPNHSTFQRRPFSSSSDSQLASRSHQDLYQHGTHSSSSFQSKSQSPRFMAHTSTSNPTGTSTASSLQNPAAAPVGGNTSNTQAPASKPKRKTGLHIECDLKEPLATFMGKAHASRIDVIKHLWDHIKRHNLQSPENKKMINVDHALRPVLQKDQVSMFELSKLINKFVQKRPIASPSNSKP
ncbi:swib mdm2 domain-containing [Cystoisospora suis]|uniref:Swib mdm2 domain-containing n=1 Tax=Cystoisospora suis TaxID=483139 RepID=A0A2C6KQI6_9APIC|nr:swib mdm2 domain-containing [Cystoisospora suis]